MSSRPIAIAALTLMIASLASCAVDPNGGSGQGMFGLVKQSPPPAPAPVAPAPAPAPYSAASVADATLQRDVIKKIGTYEVATGGSKSPTLVAARGTGRAGNSYIERWTVSSNGALVDYEVRLTPAAGGGVDFAVAPIVKPVARPVK